MERSHTKPTGQCPPATRAAEEAIGYLNYSAGRADARFLSNLNELYAEALAQASPAAPSWRLVARRLKRSLEQLRGGSEAFREVSQAEAVLKLVFEHLLPAYRRHHADLLFHQTDEALFGPFFVGRACEAVLQEGQPWEETERVVAGALARLNDYVGYRPVAVLRSEQEIQPYKHEFVRPVPIWVRGAGAAVGRYQGLVERAVAILEATEPAILRAACFDPEQLQELAFDPRAYDFDHPAAKRPNHLFGQWDLGRLDESGRAWRFVVHQILLEGLLQRVAEGDSARGEQLLFEAAAVLAGTMLMGSGVSGDRPGAHDSTVTLAVLVQRVAAYRDVFYQRLLDRMKGAHARRLRAEAKQLKQPLGGARQHVNHFIAQQRAEQLQRVRLAELFARLGQTEAARRQVHKVAVASARMECEIHCALTRARRAIEHHDWGEAQAALEEAEDVLHRAIECGALVDPWNILGFAGQFSLFPSPENSIHDYRVDDLIALVREVFGGYVRLQQAAAGAGQPAVCQAAAARLRVLAAWWDKYASGEVSGVERLSGAETCASADHVAAALAAWHAAGTAAGDIAFWRQRAAQFRSPKAYALVIRALLDEGDPVAAMALLIQWLSHAGQIALVEAEHSFFELATAWMEQVWHTGQARARPAVVPPAERWPLARKFLDYLEANAEEYWRVPEFQLAGGAGEQADEAAAELANGDAEDDLFQAAYEGVTYRDSTDDGFDGSIFDSDAAGTDFELTQEAGRLYSRLGFLATRAALWRIAAMASMAQGAEDSERNEVLGGWLRQAGESYQRLLALLDAVHAYRIAPPRHTEEAMLEYDQRQMVKLALVNHIITCCVETADAALMIRAAMDQPDVRGCEHAWEKPAADVLHAVLRQNARGVRAGWETLLESLLEQPLLYVPVEKGGHPRLTVASRGIQLVLTRLLALLPRMGLLREAYGLLEIIQDMESDHPVGPGATTEFDQLFAVGCQAIVRCLVHARGSAEVSLPGGKPWPMEKRCSRPRLIDWLESALQPLVHCWLNHSRGVRLSVLESVVTQKQWHALQKFIQRYGADLFTQKFMGLGNLRAILHQGAEVWLESMAAEGDPDERPRLFDVLDEEISREEAVGWLSLIIEAVVENYVQYVDYNSTTTQSDRGEMLYTLLDFLRLQVSYERILWNLRPLILAHEVLVRCGRQEEAVQWGDMLNWTVQTSAAQLLDKYHALVRKYGMRLRSVAQQLEGRFVGTLAVDRLCALVRPAMDQSGGDSAAESFAQLEAQAEQFTRAWGGSGFELPEWLEALSEEVQRIEAGEPDDPEAFEPGLDIPRVQLSARQVENQLRDIIEGY